MQQSLREAVNEELPEALTFRNQLDGLLSKFVADYKRQDARACAEAYAEDAVLLLPKTPPIRGRVDIAAALQAGMDAGLEIEDLSVVQCDAHGRIGYALQSVRSTQIWGAVLLRDSDCMWRIACEAAPNG